MTTSQTTPPELQPGDDAGPIIEIGPDRRLEAIERLLGAGGPPDAAKRFLEYARDQKVPLDGLWSRLDRRGRIRQTVLAVPNPGRTVMFFTSRAGDDEETRSLGGLIEHAGAEMARQGLHLAQVLLEPGLHRLREAYVAGGFRELARLSYLERPLGPSRRVARPAWPADVTVEPYRDAIRDELVEVLDASYVDTLDCPGLNGLRDTTDILEGHRSTGVFDPAFWTVMRVDNRAAGAILLNPSPAHETVELVYIGLAPSARGRGLGRELLRHGLSLLGDRRERAVTLAVDDRNTPALRLYRRAGFRRVLRRLALIRSLRGKDLAAS